MAKRRTEKTKQIQDKFMENRCGNLVPLRPLNELQARYIDFINTKKLVIATGLPGTSKTYIPTVMACDRWRKNEISKIYLTRPNVSNSKSLGFFGGTLVEKMTNWLLPVLDVMNARLGKAVVEIAIKNGDISFVPLEVIKGMSFGKNSFVICDEAEDLTTQEVKTIVTRLGGCTMVLAGDIEQSALSEKSGLAYLKRIAEHDRSVGEYTGFVDFCHPSDIVRSPECRAWILALHKAEGKRN